MNLLVSGFTGAGKSVVSVSLATDLVWSKLSGSSIREGMLNTNLAGDPAFWRTSDSARDIDMERMRDPKYDLQVDRELFRLSQVASKTVFDVWFLAWLRPPNCFSIWLEVPFEIRSQRLAESMRLTLEEARRIVADKDDRAALFAKRAYGIDMINDRSPFDLTIHGIKESGTHSELVGVIKMVLLQRFPTEFLMPTLSMV